MGDTTAPDSTTPQVRVGDTERRAVDDRLMAAVGEGVLTLSEYDERSLALWQARTRAELDALVADLPATAAGTSRPPATRPGGAPRRVVAVMSEDRFAGVVQPDQEVHALAVMGKAVLDLRRDDLPDGVRVQVRAVMGEVEVQVPAGSTVHLSGAAVMGERKVEAAPGSGPDVHVDAVAVMGSVRVTSDGPAAVPAAPRPAAVPATRPPAAPARRGHPVACRTRGVLARTTSRLAGLALPLAVLGGVVVAGPDAAAVFGSSVERVSAGTEQVRVSTLFGSVTVVVPDGTRVDTSGVVVFGSLDCETACEAGTGKVVEVRGLGGFGSVEVLTESEHRAEQQAEPVEELQEAPDTDDD